MSLARLDLAGRSGVAVLGPLPQGLPAFSIPWIAYTDLAPVLDRRLRGGPGIVRRHQRAVARLCRADRNYVDANQEMVGLGAANLAAGFFQGFPISSSSSRTPVAEAAGAKTQVTGIVGALAVALLLLVAPDLLQHLPTTALAAVVIASAIGLSKFPTFGESIVSSAGNSGCRLSASSAWRFWAPSPALAWPS